MQCEKRACHRSGLIGLVPWYHAQGKSSLGNGPTPRYADRHNAYIFMDRATLLTLRKEVKLAVLVEKSPDLINYIGLIPVNPKKFPKGQLRRRHDIRKMLHGAQYKGRRS